MGRRTVIGVMGGDDTVGALAREASEVGAAVAASGNILLTGGCCVNNNKVKDAAMYGARDVGPIGAARLIGILPNGPRTWNESQPCSLFLKTNISGEERDVINGVTPDVLIFFAGSCGTLCELAFAVQAAKPTLFWKAAQTLREKYAVHVADGRLDSFLTAGLNACREKLGPVAGIGKVADVPMLLRSLGDLLERAQDFSGGTADLVNEAVRRAGLPQAPSGFPGFRDDKGSKDRFERILERLSNCPGSVTPDGSGKIGSSEET